MKYYKSSRIYTEDGVVNGVIGVENGKIACIVEGNLDVEATDVGDLRIIPGIIDTHNHGAVGYRFEGGLTDEEFKACLKGEAAFGVTGIFPTVHVMGTYADCANAAENLVGYGSRVLGIHSEGPWGSRVGEKGDPKNTYYEAVDMKKAEDIYNEARGWLKIMSLAPEKEGALEAVKYYVDKGVVVAAYHTNANYAECMAGIDAGITNATHLGNVMTGLHHRDIGTFGACLLRDEVYCEQICDGLHVSLPMVQLVLKVKDHDKIMMVSDNGPYLGAPSGKYKGSKDNANNDRKTITVTEEGFVLSESGRLSGSSKPVLYGIGNLVEKLGMDLQEVVKLSSLNPARRFNLEGRGSIKVGNYADFVVISDDYQALKTVVDGVEVWDAATEECPFNPVFLEETRITE